MPGRFIPKRENGVLFEVDHDGAIVHGFSRLPGDAIL
jgi:hypothetical protein